MKTEATAETRARRVEKMLTPQLAGDCETTWGADVAAEAMGEARLAAARAWTSMCTMPPFDRLRYKPVATCGRVWPRS